MLTYRYRNRRQAGRRLAADLTEYAGRSDVIVLGLPRGGVEVAYEVALALRVPLDVLLVRKLGVPGHEELAMGAIAAGGLTTLNTELIAHLGITRDELVAVVRREQAELERRERFYRDGRPEPELAGKTAIVVDDGLATGSTIFAAISALRRHQPAQIVVAVPVAPRETLSELKDVADAVICSFVPPALNGVGLWYADFTQTSDDEVHALLQSAGGAKGEPTDEP